MQDIDDWTDANGELHRNPLELKALKVEFETPGMLTNITLEEFLSKIRRNYANETGREIMVESYIPEYDDYVSQRCYMADIQPSIFAVWNNLIKYNPIKFSLIGGLADEQYIYGQGSKKKLLIKFDGTTISNDKIYQEGFEFTESLCSHSELRFGCCESSALKLKIRNEFGEMNGKTLEVSMASADDMQNAFKIGVYKAETCEKSGDKQYLNITAYDKMYDIINADVTGWYDSLKLYYILSSFMLYKK